jgi:hypothetical protein
MRRLHFGQQLLVVGGWKSGMPLTYGRLAISGAQLPAPAVGIRASTYRRRKGAKRKKART